MSKMYLSVVCLGLGRNMQNVFYIAEVHNCNTAFWAEPYLKRTFVVGPHTRKIFLGFECNKSVA